MARLVDTRRLSATVCVTLPGGAVLESGALWRTCRAMSRAGTLRRVSRYVSLDRLRRSRPLLQWGNLCCRCVRLALFPQAGEFFCSVGPLFPSRRRNKRR